MSENFGNENQEKRQEQYSLSSPYKCFSPALKKA